MKSRYRMEKRGDRIRSQPDSGFSLFLCRGSRDARRQACRTQASNWPRWSSTSGSNLIWGSPTVKAKRQLNKCTLVTSRRPNPSGPWESRGPRGKRSWRSSSGAITSSKRKAREGAFASCDVAEVACSSCNSWQESREDYRWSFRYRESLLSGWELFVSLARLWTRDNGR